MHKREAQLDTNPALLKHKETSIWNACLWLPWCFVIWCIVVAFISLGKQGGLLDFHHLWHACACIPVLTWMQVQQQQDNFSKLRKIIPPCISTSKPLADAQKGRPNRTATQHYWNQRHRHHDCHLLVASMVLYCLMYCCCFHPSWQTGRPR